MGIILIKYKDELVKSMNWLSKKNNTIFLGQSVSFSGNAIFNTLKDIDNSKKIELPVFEELQMGMATGMAMEGLVPINCYPRFDFLILAMNQLVNHLDKLQIMSDGIFKPKVIIRVAIGSKKPLNGGVQHTQDYTDIMKKTLTEINVVLLNDPKKIFNEFQKAYRANHSSLMIENADFYNDK